jgi:hypothetical protein
MKSIYGSNAKIKISIIAGSCQTNVRIPKKINKNLRGVEKKDKCRAIKVEFFIPRCGITRFNFFNFS